MIFSQYLEAGYQRINTSGFPEGGYELTIKIGSSHIIHRFFTKGFSLPPEHAPQFYVVGGYLTNGMILNHTYNFLPQVLNIPILQAGINKRMSERVAVLSDILLNSHQGLLDFGFTSYLGNYFVKTAALITTKKNYGAYTMINIQKNRFNINLIVTKIFYQKKNRDYIFLNNLIGRAVTKQKKPLANTWIHADTNGIFSDNEGYFQLELPQNIRTLIAGDSCRIHLPKFNVDKAYLYIGDATCS